MKVKSESEVAQSCPTLRDSMDCSLPGSSVCGIFQARILEWVAIAFSIFSPWFLHIYSQVIYLRFFFVIWVFIAINFLQNCFAVSHLVGFSLLCFHFHLPQDAFKFLSSFFPLTHWLFRRVLFNFYLFVNFPVLLLLLICGFHIVYIIHNFL